jgi:CHAD domain-containing protein
VVVADVLDQFARNFLLNDLSAERSAKLLEASGGDRAFQLPRREPRRRNTVIGQVHQARVSIRRLRSVLQAYAGLFDTQWSSPMLVELSWYAAVLGEIRDLDVLRSGIEKSLLRIDEADVRVAIMQRLEHRIDEAQERGALERTTKRYALLVDEIATIGTSMGFNARAKGPAIEVLHAELNDTWRDVRRATNEARDKSNTLNLHELRKELKRLQCACEVLGLVTGSSALQVAHAAEATQTKLGVVHDESVAGAWLKSLVVVEPDLRGPLRDIRDFHRTARRVAKRGWRRSMDNVEERWRALRG